MIDLVPPPLILSSDYEARRPAVIRAEPYPDRHFPQLQIQRPQTGMLPGMIPVIGKRIPWSPDLLSPRVWLDTTLSTITKDGSNQVSQWNDISGNGRHATQATTLRMPIHNVANNTIEMSATTRFLAAGTSPGYLPTGASNWTFAAVFRFPTIPTSTASMITVYRQGSAANDSDVRLGIGLFNTPFNKFKYAHYFNSDLAGSLTPVINTDYIAIWTYNDTVGQGKRLYVNGTLDATSTYVNQNLSTSPSYYSLGSDPVEAADRGVSHQKTNIAFTGELSLSDRQKVEGYLAWKWGLTGILPVGHPYIFAPPYL